MKQVINNTPAASGLGDTLFVTTTKINENFTELYDLISSIQTDLETYDIPTMIENYNALHQSVGDLQISVEASILAINNNIISINNSITSQNTTITELQNIINNL